MRPPICEYDVFRQDWKNSLGKSVWDAVATIKPCGHVHFYTEFNERLKRFNGELNLGFDLRRCRWCIYRWAPEAEEIGKVGDGKLGHVFRHMDLVMSLAWCIERPTAHGGRRVEFIYRHPGDWVFRHLREYKRGQLIADGTWIGDALKENYEYEFNKAEAAKNAKIQDLVDDAMSIADKGNPNFVRTAIRVPELPAGVGT